MPETTCAVASCNRAYHAKSYCRGHYNRLYNYGDLRENVPLRDFVDKGCSIPGCAKAHYGRGLCVMHWARLRTTGTTRGAEPELIIGDDNRRFWTKTRKLPNGCVEWAGRLNENGYGEFGNSTGSELAHRWLWEHEHGPLDPKTHLDHYRYPQDGCIGPACVRHVRPTTAQENTLRGDTIAAKNKAKTHCPKDHPYSGDNLIVEKDGSRRCKVCRNETRKEGYRRVKRLRSTA